MAEEPVSGNVTTWTLSDRLRRVDVGVGVAYGSPPDKVLGLFLDVAHAHPQALPEPVPVALSRVSATARSGSR